jgi:hypothetical protein
MLIGTCETMMPSGRFPGFQPFLKHAPGAFDSFQTLAPPSDVRFPHVPTRDPLLFTASSSPSKTLRFRPALSPRGTTTELALPAFGIPRGKNARPTTPQFAVPFASWQIFTFVSPFCGKIPTPGLYVVGLVVPAFLIHIRRPLPSLFFETPGSGPPSLVLAIADPNKWYVHPLFCVSPGAVPRTPQH